LGIALKDYFSIYASTPGAIRREEKGPGEEDSKRHYVTEIVPM